MAPRRPPAAPLVGSPPVAGSARPSRTAGLQARPRALGVGVGVARQHLLADELLDEVQRPPRGGVIGIDDAPGTVGAGKDLIVADDAPADPLQQRRGDRRVRRCCVPDRAAHGDLLAATGPPPAWDALRPPACSLAGRSSGAGRPAWQGTLVGVAHRSIVGAVAGPISAPYPRVVAVRWPTGHHGMYTPGGMGGVVRDAGDHPDRHPEPW